MGVSILALRLPTLLTRWAWPEVGGRDDLEWACPSSSLWGTSLLGFIAMGLQIEAKKGPQCYFNGDLEKFSCGIHQKYI